MARKSTLLDSLSKLPKSNDRPNVLLIIADDLGKYEVSSYGAEEIETKNIDNIGVNGVRFQDAYVTAPICAPSRAAILTGKYQQRFGFETQPMEFYPTNRLEYFAGKKSNTGDWKITAKPDFPKPWMVERQGVPPEEINLAELLKSAGYKTGLIGKWHLGLGEEHIPNARGFDYQYGFYGAFSNYTPDHDTPGYVNHIHDDLSAKYQWKMGRHESAAIRENDQVVKEEDYLTFAFRDKAQSFIRNRGEDPFFLTVAFSAPHVPFQAPESYYAQFDHVKDENRRVYLSMIAALDDAVGDIMKTLDDEGILESTIVYFISDNGGASYTGATENGPLKGGKITHFEGGVNVPFFMQWKGHWPDNMIYTHPVSSLDIFATTVRACNVQLPIGHKIDGVDLSRFISGVPDGFPHDKIFWRTDHIQAIRYREWKLILSTRDGWMHLYNLETDKSEEVDLKHLNVGEKLKLQEFFDTWNESLPQDYLWPRIMDRKFIIGDSTYYFPA